PHGGAKAHRLKAGGFNLSMENKKPLALVTPAANNKRTALGLTGLTLRQLQPFDLIHCPGLESG
ncbi:hypothetical protein, partial [Ectopseudomonas oleovorans]|uniref:hypothetical protein n=1 Tax=Ectopseudomonas oleovorans TaxID=301 RepID=UPI001ABEECC4